MWQKNLYLETIGALMFYHQAPAGNTIDLQYSRDISGYIDYFTIYQCNLYNSGTSALAAALSAAIETKKILKPEIILPAYCCPDLVSAIVHADGIPVLCDLESNSARLDINQLEKKINASTVAVIAVNLFGITENGVELRQLADQHNLFLIEDSAQYFPSSIETNSWFGDYVILSFGRGKPSSILTGGAVLTQSEKLLEKLPFPKKTEFSRKKYALKVHLYNTLVNPYIYYWLTKAPILKLGETLYKPLNAIEGLNKQLEPLLVHNLSKFQKRKPEYITKYASIFSEYDFIEDLYIKQMPNSVDIPLRYPILFKTEQLREKAYQLLEKNGVGVSKMYKHSLNKIPGLDNIIAKHIEYNNAIDFANRLLTLPTHDRITDKDLQLLSKSLSQLKH